ncbi:hypothetical protein FO519_002320 [Halicephalobus sp. NKZ332]|nr:hypothetical protein FO519_002320 [Halicephalobus sp. NKZ332]
MPLAKYYNDDSFFFVPENRSASSDTFVAFAFHFGRFDLKYSSFGIDFEPRKALITVEGDRVVRKCHYPGSSKDYCIPFEEVYPSIFNVTDDLFKVSWHHGLEGLPDCFTVSKYPRTKEFGAPRRDDLRIVSCGLYRISNMFFVDRIEGDKLLKSATCPVLMRNSSFPIYTLQGGNPECSSTTSFSKLTISIVAGFCILSCLVIVLTFFFRYNNVQKKVEPVVVNMGKEIAGTHFTLDFVFEKLRDAGFDEISVDEVENLEVEDLTGGVAFFSKVLRLIFTWKDPSNRPASIVLKIPGVQKMGRNDDARLSKALTYLEYCHSNEISVYEFLHSEAGKHNISVKIPKVYYGAGFSRNHNDGLLIMEDLSPFGGIGNLLPGLNNEQIESVVEEIANIHFLSWKNPEFSKKKEERKDWNEFLLATKNVAQQLREIDPNVFNPLIDKVEKLYDMKFLKFSLYKEEQFGFPACLIHADLWAPNMIFKRSENDILAIIDFQGSHFGNPMVDIGRLLAVNTPSSYRRENTRKIIAKYFDCIKSLMGEDIPFTMEQLELAYDLGLGHVVVFMGFGFPAYLNMPAVVGEGEERVQKQRELIDRCKCFFEDAIAAFEKRNHSL